MITIAHRLHTIIDTGKILCLSKGRIENYAHPNELLQDKKTVLYELAHSLDKSEKDRLKELAKAKYLNSNRNIQEENIIIEPHNQSEHANSLNENTFSDNNLADSIEKQHLLDK